MVLVSPLASVELFVETSIYLVHRWFRDDFGRGSGQFAVLGRGGRTDNVDALATNQMKRLLLPFGASGTCAAAICCLTPFLPWFLGVLGLGGAVSFINRDIVLLPILAGFIMLTGYALWQRRRTK